MSAVLPSIVPNENAKARYALAKASNRIFARVLDSAIVLIVAIGISLLIVATDQSGIKAALNLHQTWRYFLIALLATIIFTIYFLVVPYLTNGRTLGFLVFKLRIYNLIATKNFFVNLLKREFFLWIIVAIANVILGIVLCAMSPNDAHIFLTQLTLASNEKTNQATIAIFQVLYAIATLLLIFVIIHMCINNKRRCFIDHISDTVVIKLIDVSGSDLQPTANPKTSKSRRNYGLPGEIIAGAENEIDSL